MDTTQAVSQVHARGLVGPVPTIRPGQAIRRVEVGQLVEVRTNVPGSKQNMAAWRKNTGHELVEQLSGDSTFRYVVRG